MRALAALGVAEAVAAAGFAPVAARARLWSSGTTVYRMALGPAAHARWGAPYIQIHRADLLAILIAAAGSAGAALRTGAEVVSLAQDDAGVTVRLATGEGLGGRALLGADGIHSIVRATLLGPDPARFTGQLAWRATLPAAALPRHLAAPEATVWVGPGAHLVTYYLRGGELLNLVAVTERAERGEESWTEPGDPGALRTAFRGWHPQVTALLERVMQPFRTALHDRAPLPRWSSGRITLLGDACHPMLPFLAQGAAMAIEDAATLGVLLPRLPVPEALARYEALRRPRTARVLEGAQANARRFHLAPGLRHLAAWGPPALASRLAPPLAAAVFDWLYGHDAVRAAERSCS
jgi:salicylate hydroxylase